MGLDEFINSMYLKKQEFQDALRQEAKKLKLNDIISEIERYTPEFFDLIDTFEDGQDIKFNLCQGHCDVSFNKNELILYGWGVEMVRFKGKDVRNYYDVWSEKILDAKEEDLNNVPF